MLTVLLGIENDTQQLEKTYPELYLSLRGYRTRSPGIKKLKVNGQQPHRHKKRHHGIFVLGVSIGFRIFVLTNTKHEKI